MRAVGLRELKNRLSEYFRDVRSAAGILVGRGLSSLVRKGLIEPGGSNEAARYPRLPPVLRCWKTSDLLDAERGGR